jgi:hypothetical protein
MYGLQRNEWQDLILSVNVHRKERRLSPIITASYLSRALANSTSEELSEALGFRDSTMLRQIMSLNSFPPELAACVEWGDRRGAISMTAAAQMCRLPNAELIRNLATAAIENKMTKEEVRQVVQIFSRSGKTIQECIQQALLTRPKIERSELVLGSLLTEDAKVRVANLGGDLVSKQLQKLLAKYFPDVFPKSFRINQDRFSLLLTMDDAAKFRSQLRGKSIEGTISELVEQISNT